MRPTLVVIGHLNKISVVPQANIPGQLWVWRDVKGDRKALWTLWRSGARWHEDRVRENPQLHRRARHTPSSRPPFSETSAVFPGNICRQERDWTARSWTTILIPDKTSRSTCPQDMHPVFYSPDGYTRPTSILDGSNLTVLTLHSIRLTPGVPLHLTPDWHTSAWPLLQSWVRFEVLVQLSHMDIFTTLHQKLLTRQRWPV